MENNIDILKFIESLQKSVPNEVIDTCLTEQGYMYYNNTIIKNPRKYIDLGLPSGTKWANMNIGADSMEHCGYHYTFDELHKIKNCVPTNEDFKELLKYCDTKWSTINKVNGMLFISEINGNSIFLPAAGYRNDTSLYNAGSYGYY